MTKKQLQGKSDEAMWSRLDYLIQRIRIFFCIHNLKHSWTVRHPFSIYGFINGRMGYECSICEKRKDIKRALTYN
jgi:hypothetical protein